jgi:hypothetical protein
MLTRVRSYRPSGAMLVALTALFLSTGGGGYAAQLAGQIDGHHIEKGTIEANRLSMNARADLRGGRGPRGVQGPRGGQGSRGLPGPQGPPGPATGAAGGDLTGSYPNPAIASGSIMTADFAGTATAPNSAALGGIAASHYVHDATVASQATPFDATTYKSLTVACPAGTMVVSGGAGILYPTVSANLPKLISSFKFGGGWFAEAQDDSGTARNWSLRVQALCATIS